jgi:flagellar hook protein FlgE
MLGTIYIGMAGMNAYSKGLDVISNNVANLNTTGYKAGVASFAEVVYRNSSGAMRGSAGAGVSGAGVQVNSEQQNFRQGEMRQTNNSLDAALDGNGFFVFERGGQRYYSRGGQFEFDKDGFMTDRISGSRVMVSTETSPLGSLQIDPFRVFQPRATSEVKLSGNLARTGNSTFELGNVTVLDTTGAKHTLKVKFTRGDATVPPAPAEAGDTEDPDGTDDTQGTGATTGKDLPTTPEEQARFWTVEVLDAENKVLGTGTYMFDADGTPAADNEAITAKLTPKDLPEFSFKLNVGESGSYAGISSLVNNTTSSVQVLKQDGVELGTLSAMTFDERGNLEVTYSNQEKKKIGRLVLARFDSNGDLASVGGGLYVTQEGRAPQLAGGMDFGLGKVSGGNLELSNVELTEQFADLIVVQRGYQASSQMTSVANEMLQQLLAMQDGR